MVIKSISNSIQTLIQYWKQQGISTLPGNPEKVEDFEKLNSFALPYDFREFYSLVNGMEGFYPNEIDKNGFLFYPIEAIVSAAVELPNSKMKNIGRIFLFCEYMHVSWWYGCDVIDTDNYNIGIIAGRNSFKPICTSLAEFIELYIIDSPVLYDYS
jgi:SMI1 / KNR4 family (SUKH-1)